MAVLALPIISVTDNFSAANTWTPIFANIPFSLLQIFSEPAYTNTKTLIIVNLQPSNPLFMVCLAYADYPIAFPAATDIGNFTLIPANSSLSIDLGVEGLRPSIGGGTEGVSKDRLNFWIGSNVAPTAGVAQFSISCIQTRGFLGI